MDTFIRDFLMESPEECPEQISEGIPEEILERIPVGIFKIKIQRNNCKNFVRNLRWNY